MFETLSGEWGGWAEVTLANGNVVAGLIKADYISRNTTLFRLDIPETEHVKASTRWLTERGILSITPLAEQVSYGEKTALERIEVLWYRHPRAFEDMPFQPFLERDGA